MDKEVKQNEPCGCNCGCGCADKKDCASKGCGCC